MRICWSASEKGRYQVILCQSRPLHRLSRRERGGQDSKKDVCVAQTYENDGSDNSGNKRTRNVVGYFSIPENASEKIMETKYFKVCTEK